MMKRIAQDALDAPVLKLSDAVLADTLRAQRERLLALAGLEDELVDLLLRALLRLVEEELRIAPEHVRSIAQSELSRLGRAQHVVLHVHPDDMILVRSLIEESPTEGLSLEADPSLARGDCVLQSELGSMDARMHTKLERLGALIREGRAS